MGKFLEQLQGDLKVALKAGDKPKLAVVRMLIADLQRKALDGKDDTLSDEVELAVLQKAVKTRADTVQQAKEAGRDEIAQNEQAEIAIIETYLPAQMSAEEVAAKVAELCKEIGYTGPKDTGRFMKEWMSRYKGLADGRAVQTALKAQS